MSETKEVIIKLVFSGMETSLGWNSDIRKYDLINYNLKFHAVADNSSENKIFWKYTPSGEFHFATVNAAAAKMFKFGHEYYVTFKDVNPEEPAVPVN